MPYEGCHPSIIEWGYQINQLVAVDAPRMEGSCQLVKDANPGVRGKVKILRIELGSLSYLRKTLLAEDFPPQRRELLKANLKIIDHTIQIDLYGLGFYMIFMPKDLDRFTPLDLLPVAFMALHEGKDGPEHLTEHRP